MQIRKFRKSETREVALLVMRTYKKFNSKEYFNKKAVQTYLDHYDPKKNSVEEIYENFKQNPIFYVATENNKIIGVIRGRPNRITNLFVEGKKHRKGIGRRLVNIFENTAKKQKSREIKIRASLYATPFYEKMGYKKTTGIRNFRGLKIFPMKKDLR